MKALTLLTFAAVLSLSSCTGLENKAGITFGQGLGLAADLVQGYETARANKPAATAPTPSGKDVVDLKP